MSADVQVLGFHHHTLLVRDLDRATLFYEGVLHLPRKTRPNFGNRGAWYDMSAGQELHLIEAPHGVPPENEGHPAFEVNDLRAAVAACRAAEAIGVRVQQDVFVRTHDDSLSAFVRDADQNMIELTQHKRP